MERASCRRRPGFADSVTGLCAVEAPDISGAKLMEADMTVAKYRPSSRGTRSIASQTKASAKPLTKTGIILRSVKRARGARMTDLQKVTGWQPHSVRAAISGLRKQGIAIARERSKDGASIYRVVRGQ